MIPRLAFLLSVTTIAIAQPGPPPREGGPAAEARAGRRGPWDQDVWVYRIGATGAAERVATFERAGVRNAGADSPCATRRIAYSARSG